ncbi:MAG: permease [Candidatus Methylacidiphilales bacterium]
MFVFSFQDFALSFLSVLLEGLPFVLLGTLISGFIDEFLPPGKMEQWLPRNRLGATVLSGFLGLIFPMCECGVVPVIRRLLRKGLPLSCAVTYMLAAPIVSPVVLLSTYVAFKGQDPMWVTSLRLVMGYVVALCVGLVVLRLRPEQVLKPGVLSISGHHHHHHAPMGWHHRLRRALGVSAHDFTDVMFFLVLGAAMASLFNTGFDHSQMERLASGVVTPILTLMGAAFVFSLCSTSDAFIAASFFSFPIFAKLAFLVFGPVADLKLVALYATVFQKRFIAGMILGSGLLVLVLCRQLAEVLAW